MGIALGQEKRWLARGMKQKNAGQDKRDEMGGQDKHDKETGKERLVMQRRWEGQEGSQHSGKNCGPRGERM